MSVVVKQDQVWDNVITMALKTSNLSDKLISKESNCFLQ